MARIFLPNLIRPPQIVRVAWNPNDASPSVALTNNNLTATMGGTLGLVRATVARSTGKRYFEFVWGVGVSAGGSNSPSVGLVTGAGMTIGSPGLAWYGTTLGGCFFPAYDGSVYDHLYSNTGGPVDLNIGSAAPGDVGGIFVDFPTGKVWFARNGSVANGGNPGAGTGQTLTLNAGLTLFPAVTAINGGGTARFRSDHWTQNSYGFTEF